MRTHSFASEIAYCKELAGAGWNGIASARRQSAPTTGQWKAAVWIPAAIGVAAGILGTRLCGKRKSAAALAAGGVLGSAALCGAVVAWAQRKLMLSAARGAARQVTAVRDARWLAANPINYA